MSAPCPRCGEPRTTSSGLPACSVCGPLRYEQDRPWADDSAEWATVEGGRQRRPVGSGYDDEEGGGDED